MTFGEVWDGVQGPAGALLILLITTALFFRGSLVNGGVARQARLDGLDEQRQGYEEQIALMKQRYDEMQTIMRERINDITRERDYYRTLALSNARQTEEALSLAKDKLPQL